ncbi:hypothetical protein C8250_021750 [Streptomyces sp. So13.3]|uniref:hypothetical protein n=1 Tax=Streptomyces sp. So13.3 TaxID=2136173 RepID=UPI0011070B71|nr:hypothetical protein [Streptomyces sp. So13.3]QNA74183.1 hypothetical protein C8250_021750 [Streptomyces sp. So13.3]
MTLALAASALILLFTLGYVALCAANPFAACRKCRGFGFLVKTTRRGKAKRGRDCRRCKGHGARIRIGRHLWNLWRRTYSAGTR